MVNGRWAQLGFDEAVHSMPYEGVHGLRACDESLFVRHDFIWIRPEQISLSECFDIVEYIVTGGINLGFF